MVRGFPDTRASLSGVNPPASVPPHYRSHGFSRELLNQKMISKMLKAGTVIIEPKRFMGAVRAKNKIL
jgi:hypothetical protein